MSTRTELAESRSEAHAELPAGRLLYRPMEHPRYVVVGRGRPDEVWIVEDGWESDGRAAGPFRPEDALRAVRLANTKVPEGCELGPWQDGIGLFAAARLPLPAGRWARVGRESLGPSVSRYVGRELVSMANEGCCAPPADRPRVNWIEGAERIQAIAGVVRERCPELRLNHAGVLQNSWNVHPKGSPVVAEDVGLEGLFVVIEL